MRVGRPEPRDLGETLEGKVRGPRCERLERVPRGEPSTLERESPSRPAPTEGMHQRPNPVPPISRGWRVRSRRSGGGGGAGALGSWPSLSLRSVLPWLSCPLPLEFTAAVDALAPAVRKNGVDPDMVCRVAASRDASTWRRNDFERSLQALSSPRGRRGLSRVSGSFPELVDGCPVPLYRDSSSDRERERAPTTVKDTLRCLRGRLLGAPPTLGLAFDSIRRPLPSASAGGGGRDMALWSGRKRETQTGMWGSCWWATPSKVE